MTLSDGDVIGFSGKGLVSDAINVGTWALPRWGLSHIGIVSTYKGIPMLFESTSVCSDSVCAITGEPISGVQAHKLDELIRRPGRVWQYRPVKPLNGGERLALKFCLLHALGQPYDYVGAARSGGFLLRLIEGALRQPEVTKLFCSELVALALNSIGKTRIANVSAQSPNSLGRYLQRHGVYKRPTQLK